MVAYVCCLDGMGQPCDHTVQDIVTISQWITDVDFPSLMGGCNLVWEFDGRNVLIMLFHKQVFLRLFRNEKRGGLWMVRYSLYHGGRMLILRVR